VLLYASRPRRTAAPTPLDLPDLAALTRSVAAQVRTGAHEVVLDPDRRWYRRLYADPFVDVWLISWVAEKATELHDHAGSLGALTVVSGVLDEQRWVQADGALRSRRLRAGRAATFGLGHVHDVVNTQPAHAVSVHAYSPPLTAMSYYAVDPGGALRRTRSVLTDGGSA
jgi:predicted metal-dependent enzyme (double-stranded beta helix superfamily)